MDDDTKAMLRTIVSIIIGGAVVYYLFYRPSVQLQQSNQLKLQQEVLKLQEQQQLHNIKRYLQEERISNTENIGQNGLYPSPTSYKNNEKWEIVRGKNGFISNISVLRDAKTT